MHAAILNEALVVRDLFIWERQIFWTQALNTVKQEIIKLRPNRLWSKYQSVVHDLEFFQSKG